MSGRLTNKRVVLYQRYSTDLQSDRSLADQLHANREFVRREGGDADGARVIGDPALSGASYLRPGFTELLKLVEARLVDAIVTEDLSRLSRNAEHLAALMNRIDRSGVLIFTVMDGCDTGQPGARLNYALKGLFSSETLVELGHRTRRGLTGRARAGLSTGGRTYGFGSEPIPDSFGGTRGSNITVLPEQAAVVVRMFKESAAGVSLDKIAFGLNRDKVPSPRAARPRRVNGVRQVPMGWSGSTVRSILHNPAYIGQRVYNQRAWSKITDIEHVTKTGTEPRRYRKRDPSEFVHSEGPRIIEQLLWDDVQGRLRAVHAFYTKDSGGLSKGRAAQPGRPTTHLLSGLLRCECGASFVLVGGSTRKYYGCNNAKKRGPHICTVSMLVPEDVARTAILGALSARLFTREAAVFMREEVARLLGEKGRSDDSELKAHRANRARHQAKVDALVDFIAGGDSSEAVRQKLRDCETLLRAEERVIKELEDAARKPVRLPTPDEVLESARNFEKTLMTDATRGRAMLLQLFEDGNIVLEPQAAGYFIARSRVFPLLALTSALETKTPRTDESPGRSERATALSCAGRI